MSVKNKLYYIIPTSIKYKDIVLPKLLNSLDVSKDQIIVVVNQSPKKEIKYDNNIMYYYLKTCSFEYAAPIVALKLLNYNDYFFWLHDTCEAGKNFVSITSSFNYENYDFVDIFHGYCNFGIYSVGFIAKDSQWVFSLQNITKKIAVENEFHYYNNFKSTSKNIQINGLPGVNIYQKLGEKDIYNQGTTRLVEYYSSIDLYKYKANWFRKSEYFCTP